MQYGGDFVGRFCARVRCGLWLWASARCVENRSAKNCVLRHSRLRRSHVCGDFSVNVLLESLWLFRSCDQTHTVWNFQRHSIFCTECPLVAASSCVLADYLVSDRAGLARCSPRCGVLKRRHCIARHLGTPQLLGFKSRHGLGPTIWSWLLFNHVVIVLKIEAWNALHVAALVAKSDFIDSPAISRGRDEGCRML